MFTPFNIMVSPLSVTREALPVISSASRPPLPHAVRSTMTINPCYHMLNSRELHCFPDAHWGKAGLSKVTVREMTEYREMGGLVSLESLFFFFLYIYIFYIAWLAAVIIWLLLFSPSVHACAIEAMLSQWHRVWREPTRAKWPVRDLLVFSYLFLTRQLFPLQTIMQKLMLVVTIT